MLSRASALMMGPTLPRWLERFRLAIFISELLVVGLTAALSSIELPVPALLALLTYAVATNGVLRLVSTRSAQLHPHFVTAILAHDVALLTLLLLLSGGVHNPFSALFLVYVALGPMLLSGRLTALLVVFSIVCFATLFVVSGGVSIKGQPLGLDHATQMRIHMRGMWVAFAVAAVLIGFIVQRVRGELEQQTVQLENVRLRQARVDKLGALATLAASATHELGTPLATIALVAKELERAVQPDSSVQTDAALIRSQVERCRVILERLSVDAGALNSGVIERTSLQALVDVATDGLQRVSVQLAPPLGALQVVLPSKALAMALRNVVKNGLEASGADASLVVLEVTRADASLEFRVTDRGSGMSADHVKQATEPFFSTKGHGMGLGLFLARSVAEQLDGSLELMSQENHGTTVRIRVPFSKFEEAPT